jgi:metallo-beta-lactamase family protein
LIVESTYGDRLHDKSNPLDDELAEVIQQTAARGGSVIIPAFAVGRTQDLLYYLYLLKKEKRIPDIPVFLNSPMAQNVSDLLYHYSGEHRLTKELAYNICQIAKYTKTSEESKSIDQYRVPIIIISASGMAEGGRILHHLKAFLPDERSTILLGYQDAGTRGDRLLRGELEIKIHGAMISVRAQIKSINSMSAHADYQEMLVWLGNFKHPPQKVFITHGDLEATKALKNKIEEKFNWTCIVPNYLQTETLN